MKSLLKSANLAVSGSPVEHDKSPSVDPRQQEAQCCAKVSKTVAGCHD
jgi:hypothetical protein